MVADGGAASLPAHRLAQRLRELREQANLTQRQLANTLGGTESSLSIATISQWEKPDSGRVPPPPRLAAYARLFCTSRSVSDGRLRLLGDDELTEDERQREAELRDDLIALRAGAQQGPEPGPPPVVAVTDEPRPSIWNFPDELAVSIVCSDSPEPPEYANPSHGNYSRYARYADLDALIEIFGQVKADNPERMVRILPTASLAHDFALNHLIIIGGAASDATQQFAQDIPLPEAEPIPDTDTYLFRCTVGEETREFISKRDGDNVLVQDVALFARGPHPIIPGGTVTLLSGITSRGVHGAALCFLDSHVRETNEGYLQRSFGDTDSFCVLMNVPVQNNAALPPNLWRDGVRLYEWSPETGARW